MQSTLSSAKFFSKISKTFGPMLSFAGGMKVEGMQAGGITITLTGALTVLTAIAPLIVVSSAASAKPKPTTPEPVLLQTAPAPDAKVQPTKGVVNIKLVNNTYTTITYQAIGDTEERTLAARSTITLRNLRMPTSMTFYRSDRGFLVVKPVATGEMLQLTMGASDDFSVDKTFVEIKATGEVYLN